MVAERERLTIKISGKVQGVFFRATTLEKANELGIVGYVRNGEDGSVLVVAEGRAEQLDRLAAWCAAGPTTARVTGCDVKRGRATGEFQRFRIQYE